MDHSLKCYHLAGMHVEIIVQYCMASNKEHMFSLYCKHGMNAGLSFLGFEENHEDFPQKQVDSSLSKNQALIS